jgi:hypothetical protein
MRIYIKNININVDTLHKSKYLFNISSITKLFTKSGIFIVDDNIKKLQIVDKPIVEVFNKNTFIIDNSEYYLVSQVYQIPYEYYKQDYQIHNFIINPLLKLHLIIESNNENKEIYFFVDNPENNIDNILNDISTFLSSFNFY